MTAQNDNSFGCLVCGATELDAVFALFCGQCVVSYPEYFADAEQNILSRLKTREELVSLYFGPYAQRHPELDDLVADMLSDKQVDELLNLVNAIAWQNSDADMKRMMNFAPPRLYIGIGIGPPALRFGLPSPPGAIVVCRVERNSRAARSGLLVDDSIISMNGVLLHKLPQANLDLINAAIDYLHTAPGPVLTMSIVRDGAEMQIVIDLE